MFSSIIKSIALSAVKHLVAWGGEYLVAAGLLTTTDENQGVGAVMTLVGLAWAAYQKHQAKKVVAAAAPSAPTDLTGNTDPIIPVVDGGPLPPATAAP